MKVLRDVAKHYGFSDVDEEFLSLSKLRPHERCRKEIMHVVWLAFTLDVTPTDARSIMDKFIEARETFTRRPRGAPAAQIKTVAESDTPPITRLASVDMNPTRMIASAQQPIRECVETPVTQSHTSADPFIPLHRSNRMAQSLAIRGLGHGEC